MLSHVPPSVILPATTGLLQLTKIKGKFPYLAYHTGISRIQMEVSYETSNERSSHISTMLGTSDYTTGLTQSH